jgi:microcystin-dependent protein
MSTPYLAQIMITGFNFAPKGWQMCNGQVLPINQNAALFSLLGTTFGGNGTTTFWLPNLQGASPIHMGTPPGGQTYVEGQTGGLVNVTLLSTQIPAHTHQAMGVSTLANLEPAAGNAWANSAQNPYAATANVTMSPNAVTQTGGQPHPNQPPYLVLNFVIALSGIFPSRS